MAQSERHDKLRRWLVSRRCVTPAWAIEQLDVSRSTLTRDIAFLRDRLGMPIVWSPERQGWHIDREAGAATAQFELPGLWFSAEEVHALLMMQHLLSNLDAAGLLGPHIEPLMRRLGRIFDAGVPPKADVARRIRVQTVGARKVHVPHFQAVGSALLRRQRLLLHYRARSRPQDSADEAREVSPQRLVHYRDNWYLDAWCHARQGLRSFSVDAIAQVQVLDLASIDIDDGELDAVLGSGYGIFSGRQMQWATLRFSAERSRWVAAETWHREQRGRRDSEGRWLLTLPYADPRELVMDILRHVPEVEVLAPEELEAEVKRRLRTGLGRMEGVDE